MIINLIYQRCYGFSWKPVKRVGSNIKLYKMKKVIFILSIAIISFTFFGFTTARIDGTNIEFTFEDLHYSGDDIDETPIYGFDTGRGIPGTIVFCPGTGQTCNVIVVIPNWVYAIAGKKTPGGPSWTFS